jgi:hypothetical protein
MVGKTDFIIHADRLSIALDLCHPIVGDRTEIDRYHDWSLTPMMADDL